MKLKKIHLPIVVAEASDLTLGTLGEFVTADTLKPYLDAIATKATPAEIATAVSALETKILGGAGIDADTLAELNAKVGALQNITDADKTGLLNILATCVKTTDIMPLLDAKASEQSVVDRLALKANINDVATSLNGKLNASILPLLEGDINTLQLNSATKEELGDLQLVVNSKASQTEINDLISTIDSIDADLSSQIATKATPAEVTTIATTIANSLEAKILGGVGTDTDNFAELKAYLESLQDLSEADINGVMTAVSAKIDKSAIYGQAIQSEFGLTLNQFTLDNDIADNDSQPIAARLVLKLLLDVKSQLNTKAGIQSINIINSQFIQGDDRKLNTNAFGNALSNEIVSQTEITATQMFDDKNGDGFFMIPILDMEESTVKRMNYYEFISFFLTYPGSPLATYKDLVQQNLDSKDADIAFLTERVAALEVMFEA